MPIIALFLLISIIIHVTLIRSEGCINRAPFPTEFGLVSNFSIAPPHFSSSLVRSAGLKNHYQELEQGKDRGKHGRPHNPTIGYRFVIMVICLAVSVLIILRGGSIFLGGSRFVGIFYFIVAFFIYAIGWCFLLIKGYEWRLIQLA